MSPEKIGLEAQFLDSQWKRGTDEYLRQVDKMDSATSRVAAGIGKSYSNLGGAIAGVVAAATAAVTAVATLAARELAGWTVEGVKSALDLEQQIAAIAAVMGETTDAVQPLEDTISKLALDPHLKVSANEAADAIELLARNGLDMATIMGGAAEKTVLLANATKADFGTAADLVTDVMAIFNIKAEDMAGAVDGITSVVNNSKFSIDDYRLALARGGVAAHASGVSFKDFNSIIAFTAANFTSGQTAGTGWASFLTRLVPQSNKAKDAMKELGIVTEDGTNRFFDASGQLKDMGEIIDVVNGAFGGLTEEQRITYAQMIFGRDAAEALFSMIGKTGDEFETFQATLGDTSALESAQTATSTLSAKFEVFRDLMDEIQRQSGKQFFDVLGKIVGVFTDLASENSDKVIALFGNLADIAETAAEKFLPLVQERLPAFLSNLQAMASWLLNVVQGEGLMNEALDEMSPGLANFVAGVVNVITTLGIWRDRISEVISRVWEALTPVRDWIAAHIELKDVLIAAAGAVAAFLAPLALAIAQMALVGAAAAAAVALMRNAWETDFGGIKTFITKTWGEVEGILRDGWIALLEGDFSTAWEKAKEAGTIAMQNLRDATKTAMGEIARLFEAGGPGAKIVDWFDKIFPKTLQTVVEQMPQVSEAFQAMVDQIGPVLELLNRLWEGHGNKVVQIIDVYISNALERLSTQMEIISFSIAAVLSVINGDWESFWQNINRLGELQGKQLIGNNISLGKDLINVWTDTGENSAKGYGDGIKEGSKEAEKETKNFGQRIIDEMKRILGIDSPSRVFHQIGVDSTTGMADGVQSGIPSVLAKAQSLVSQFVSKFDTLANDVRAKFQSVMDAANNILNPAVLADKGRNLVQGFIDGVGGMIGAAQSKVSELMNLAQQAAEAALGIGSPSKVFAGIGANAGASFLNQLGAAMALARPMLDAALGPIQMQAANAPAAMGAPAVAAPAFASPTFTPPASVVNNASASFGPITVNNVMDAAQLEYTIRRVVNGMI